MSRDEDIPASSYQVLPVTTSAYSCHISRYKFFYSTEDPIDWMPLPSVQRVGAVQSQRGVWKRLAGLGSAFWKWLNPRGSECTVSAYVLLLHGDSLQILL